MAGASTQAVVTGAYRAVELKSRQPDSNLPTLIGVVCVAVALVFVWRSFYAMRIPETKG